jgi:gliding motility-associated-like protein
LIRRSLTVAGCLFVFGLSGTRAQAPVPDFTASVTSGCGPLSVQFKDLTANGPLFWTWDFGNGQTSALQNPTVSYGIPGVYTVTLIAKNRSGADAIRKTDYITVFPYPTPQFTSNLTLACSPANVQFTDQSTAGQGSITSWLWDLGDGTTSSQQNPSNSYSQPGYYNVTLKVTNSGGCSNTAARTRYLRVVDGVQANFTWNQTSAACSAPFALDFINQTAGPGNLTYSWNFGNGANPAASTDASPANITYAATGNYNVSLQVSSSLGCSGSVQKTVPLNNSAAVINSPDQACANVPVAFTDGSTPAPLSVAWDFGDGTTSADPNPSKTYTANGTYTVKLINTYASCTSSATKTLQVSNPSTPAFTADKTVSCSAPLAVQFTDQTPPGATQWLWDFGDGQTSTLQNPSHTYNTTGQFTVKLTTTTAGGCSNTTARSGYIIVVAPSVNLDINSLSGCVSPATLSPVAQPSTVDGVSSWAWTVNGASPSSSTSQNPAFSFPAPGVYTGSVTITTNGGCTATQSFSVQVGTPTPAAITVSPGPYCGRDPVTFSDPVTPGTENEYQWLWSFGDGQTAQVGQPSVSHSFFDIAQKNVTLTLIHNGCATVATKTISISPPVVWFAYQPQCKTDKFAVDFTDTSKLYSFLSPFTSTWNFGDNSATATTTPGSPISHIYPSIAAPTRYDVTLTTTDGVCTQHLTKTIVVGPIPFTFTSPSQQCSGSPIHLTATSPNADLIAGYYWHWDTDPNQAYVFSSSPSTDMINTTRGNRTLTLVIQLANGCLDSLAHPVLITYPDALFTNPAGACKNGTVSFTDKSTPDPVTNSPVSIWSWDFGDNSIPATTQNPTHQYTDTGYFTPKLIIKDQLGCARTYIAPTPTHITAPIANFIGPDSFYCTKTPLVFKDSSTGFNLTNSWSYGDGSADDATGIHSYTNNQTYNVTLTVTDQFACTDVKTKPVRIQQPIAAFDISDTTAICIPLQTKFTAHGQFYDSLYWDFGDGSTSTLPATSHFYNTTDTFYAKLFVRGPGGCLDSAVRRILVLDPQATTKFSFGPLSQCDSVPVQFNLTAPGYTRFTLVFGDGAMDSSQNTRPFHMYRNPAAYTPTLVLVDPTGCIVNIGSPVGGITVLGSVPFMSLDPHAFCDNGIVTFTDYTITNDGIVSETLDFGDGTPPQTHNTGTADFNTDHFYTKPGAWLATLKVITNNNCAETYTDTVHIFQTPHPVITVVSELCTGLIQFNGGLTAPQGDPISWAWDFGNGSSSKEQNPAVDLKPGTYTVRLHTAIPFGCNDTTSKAIIVQPLPEIKGPREISTPVGAPITIPFTYSSNVNAWTWTPTGHLDCSNCGNPTATLIFSQQYHVTVTDANNCSSSDSILIKTICNDKNYFIPNTFSPNGDGVNDYFYPRGSNLYNIQSLRVFNRWGQMVFERRDFPANAATMGWDGTFNGRPAPVDAYVYIAEVVCDNAQIVALHGDVTLIR